jgi:hypothetical protein
LPLERELPPTEVLHLHVCELEHRELLDVEVPGHEVVVLRLLLPGRQWPRLLRLHHQAGLHLPFPYPLRLSSRSMVLTAYLAALLLALALTDSG